MPSCELWTEVEPVCTLLTLIIQSCSGAGTPLTLILGVPQGDRANADILTVTALALLAELASDCAYILPAP